MASQDKLKGNILIVEDEPSQAEILVYNLEAAGYLVFRAETGEEALLTLEEQNIDLVLLDWMLPNISGLEVCRQIKRKKASQTAYVIMLTARGDEDDKIRGLDTGADDYLVKPYSLKELLARVRVGIRSLGSSDSSDKITYSNIVMDLEQMSVFVGGQRLELGPLEFKLLRVLIKKPTRVVSRDYLLDRVWDGNLEVQSRTVDVHVGRLRKQLQKVQAGHLIRTVRGFGYALDDTQ